MISKSISLDLLYRMILIRSFEDVVSNRKNEGLLYGSVHCCQGEEAIAVGICACLNKEDYVISDHRPHGHGIAKGVSIKEIMAEIYGKSTGCSGGRGGSMHLSDINNGFLLSTGIVGSGIPIISGAAFASKYLEQNRIACGFFGDGSANEGTFSESLNIAAIYNLPALFVVEDNGLAVTTGTDQTSACRDYTKLAQAFGIESELVNGQDVEEVYNATKRIVPYVREGHPFLIQARTIRFHEHAEGKYYLNMKETGYRDNDLLERQISSECPIKIFENKIRDNYAIGDSEIDNLRKKAEKEVFEAEEFAVNSIASE